MQVGLLHKQKNDKFWFVKLITPESRAIIRYIAAKYVNEGPNLVGKSLEERGVVDQWLEVEANNLNPLILQVVLQLVILPRMGIGEEKIDSTLVQDCVQKLEKAFDVYEQRLSKHHYLAGDSFTLADLSTHLPGIRYILGEWSWNGAPDHCEEECECMVGAHLQ